MSLIRSLSLSDLTLFGIVSIMGSGGFNLIGEAVHQGGFLWPVACGTASALLLGASHTYSRMYDTSEKGNTMESDLVSNVFGKTAEWATISGILLFNIVSISVILVLCSHMLFPGESWLFQISFALLLLAGMATLGLQGLDVNKSVVNALSVGLVLCLSAVAGIGFFTQGSTRSTLLGSAKTPFSFKGFKCSLLLFFFVLAGFDVLTKFTEEAKDPENIPKSFFTSNILSGVLTLGVALAIFRWAPLTDANQENAMGQILETFLGKGVAKGFDSVIVLFMLAATFIVFLSVSRNIYGLGERFKISSLTSLTEGKAPHIAIGVVAVIAAIFILNNHTETLVTISNAGLIVTMLLVSASVTLKDWNASKITSALLSGATTAGFGGLLAMCSM